MCFRKKINDKYTIVNTILEATSKNPEVKIDWKIYTKNRKAINQRSYS